MYSIYQIYQSDKLVYSTYHTMNNQYSNKTKLDIILTSPVTPHLLTEAYFKTPTLFTIQLVQEAISNALEATEALNRSIDSSIEEPLKQVPKTRKRKSSATIKTESI